jgi:hypothetical protein
MNLLSSSLQRLNLRLLALQLFGNAGLLLAAALWLEIPDSHLWELLLSLLFGVALLVGLPLLQTTIIRRVRAAKEGSRLWLGAVLLAVWAFLFYIPSILIGLVTPYTYQRASYWNSQLSPHMRTIFTYDRLSHWQFLTFDLIIWFIVPALLLPFVIETVTRGVRGYVWRAGIQVLGQWKYWLSCLMVGMILHFMVLPLIDWQPGHSVAAEIVSVMLRLGLVYVSIVLLLTLLLAFTAALLAKRDTIGDTVTQPIDDHTNPISLDQ